MSRHPGPRPAGFTYDPTTARALMAAAERLADAAHQLARRGQLGRHEVESTPFEGWTATELRTVHDRLDAELRSLADAAREQVAQLELEVRRGLDLRAEAAAAQRSWLAAQQAWEARR